MSRRTPEYEAWSLSVAAGRPFFGRTRELAELQRSLRGARLVTVTGTAGVGKTRLVQRYLEMPGPGRTLFVDVSTARSAADVTGAVRTALGLDADGDVVTAMGDALLVLDNFEQVVRAAEETVGAWLQAGKARFVVTSRARLGLADEIVLPLEPFDPTADAKSDAVRLFAARARAVSGRNPLQETPDAVYELVRILDGLPLALEMAAGRTQVLGVPKLVERLRGTIDILKADHRDVPERQTTLEKAIRWSWELLVPAEQDALLQCAVFAGDFDLDAAEAVVRTDAIVMDLVQRLCDESLVQATPDGTGELRFRLYVSVRDFALDRLRKAGGYEAAADRRDDWYLGLPWDDVSEEAVGRDRHHLAAVLERALIGPLDAVRRSRGLGAAVQLARIDGLGPDARRRLDTLLSARDGLAPALVARGLAARASQWAREGRVAEQQADLAAALELARSAGHGELSAVISGRLALARFDTGELAEALDLAEAAWGWFRDGDPRKHAEAALRSAYLLQVADRLDEGRVRALEALRHLEGEHAAGPVRLRGALLARLGAIEHDQGDLETAREHLDRAIRALDGVESAAGRALAQYHRGVLLQEVGDLDDARTAWLDGLAGATQSPVARGLCEAALGALCALQGDREEALRRLTTAEELAARVRVGRLTWPVRLFRALVDATSGVPERLEQARATLAAAEPAQRVPEARGPLGLLRDTVQAGEAGAGLVVGPESRWFSVHGRPPVDLVRRGAMRRMVDALVDRRLTSPGAAMTNAELFELGWPGERIREESAAHRVRVAVSSLRKMGLADVLERSDQGYAIRADVDVRRE